MSVLTPNSNDNYRVSWDRSDDDNFKTFGFNLEENGQFEKLRR